MRTHATFQHQRGFTLIELLLYVSIVGTLLLSMTMFFALSVDSRVKNQSVSEVDQQGVAAMDYITQTIRNASSITSPAAAGSAASLTLVVPTASLSPTVFDLSGTTLQVKEGSGAAVALTNAKVQASSLTFKNLSPSPSNKLVQVSFTIGRVNPASRNEYSYQKTFVGSAAVRP